MVLMLTKEIREYISCPQFGDDHYGKWGALRLDQRKKIKELIEYTEKLDEIVENLTTMTACGDRKQIKNTAQYKLELAEQKINKAIEWVKKNQYYFPRPTELLEILGDKENE